MMYPTTKSWRRCSGQWHKRCRAAPKSQGYGGHTVTLKLKTADFKQRTRATTLEDATQLAHRMFDATKPLLRKEATGAKFRLIGIALSHLEEMSER